MKPESNPNSQELQDATKKFLEYGKSVEGLSFSLPLDNGENKKFDIQYDPENQSFRIYQKEKNRKKNISPEALYKLEQCIEYKGYATFMRKTRGKDHVMVDATSLTTILSSLDMQKPDDLTAMEALEKEIRTKLIAQCNASPNAPLSEDELATLFKENRVFLDQDAQGNPCWTTCIDTKKGTYLSATPDELPTLVGYLNCDYYLRRKKELPIKVFPVSQLVQQREFKTNEDSDSAKIKLIFDGADDTASALTSSGLPQQTVNIIQSLLVFPVFLSFVEIGVSGMAEGLEESSENIIAIKKTIAACKDRVKDLDEFITQIKNGETTLDEDALKEKLTESITAISELQDQQATLFDEKSEKLANSLGHPGMVMMFTGLLGFEIQSFLNMVGGAPMLSKGLEGTPVGTKFGIDPQLPLGMAGVVGNGTVFVGQLLMTAFAAINVKEEFKNIKETNEDIATLKHADTMTEALKKELIAFKKDERLFAAQRLAGNAMLGLGQGTMAVSGPIGLAFNPGVYAGLVLTLMGVGLGSASQLREIKLYGHDEETSGLEQEILSKTEEAITTALLEDLTKSPEEYNQQESEKKYAAIASEATFSLEALHHLQKIPLATHKLFKSAVSTADLESAKKKGKQHYASRSHQQGLLKTLENLELPPHVADFLQQPSDNESDFMKKTCVLYAITEALTPSKEDLAWISMVGELLKSKTKESEHDQTEVIIGKLQEHRDTIPEEILNCITDPNTYSRSPEEIIEKIQKAYVNLKLKNCHPEQEYSNKDVATLKKELSQKINDSKTPRPFEKRILDTTYKKKKKTEGAYKPEDPSSPIHSVGTLTKKDKGLLKDRVHKKNVYQFNKEALNRGFEPKDMVFKDYVYNYRKSNFRSDYFRSAHAIMDEKAEKKEAVAMELLQKSMVVPTAPTTSRVPLRTQEQTSKRATKNRKKIGPKPKP